MLRNSADILWQLERKWKFRCSSGTNRLLTVSKTAILALILCAVFALSTTFSSFEYPTTNNNVVPVGVADYKKNHFQELIISNLNSPVPFVVENATNAIIKKVVKHFKRADKDRNSVLDMKEIAVWINQEISAHFSKAMKENFNHYFRIDTKPQNGIVSWEEFLNFYFASKLISGKITEDDVRKRTTAFQSLPKSIKVELARLQASWSEAAINNPDFLTVDEFLAFEHPEASPTKILSNVQDVFSTFDLDGDGIITTDEFETTYKEAEGVDLIYKTDKHLIDSDGNGKISRIEMMRYMDPRGLHHSEKEAKELINSVDKNKDGRLNLFELMQSVNIVVKSSFFDAEKHIHSHD